MYAEISHAYTEDQLVEQPAKRTSGHRTTDVVTEHYNKPGEQQHLKTLNGDGAGAKSRNEQLREIIRRMASKTLKKDKVRLLAILDGKAKGAQS